MRSRAMGLGVVVFGLFACDSQTDPNHGGFAPLPHPEAKPQVIEDPAQKPPAPAEASLTVPADPNEACAKVIVVAYQGAKFADPAVTRDRAAAEAEAKALLAELRKSPAGFEELARNRSDAPTSAARGGFTGTHMRDDWPALHEALKQPLFALKVNEIAADPVEADYGFVVLQRCPVEKVHARHILLRYKGAKNADKTVKREKAAALAVAKKLKAELDTGADFADLAKQHSEDSSADRGGDLGDLGRGLLAPAFEQTLFELPQGQVSPPVETAFGYHLIQRLP